MRSNAISDFAVVKEYDIEQSWDVWCWLGRSNWHGIKCRRSDV
jgi:hypothetical protein